MSQTRKLPVPTALFMVQLTVCELPGAKLPLLGLVMVGVGLSRMLMVPVDEALASTVVPSGP